MLIITEKKNFLHSVDIFSLNFSFLEMLLGIPDVVHLIVLFSEFDVQFCLIFNTISPKKKIQKIFFLQVFALGEIEYS